jgi:hypothetical protein
MADVDLRALSPNDVVLHFGGRPNEVDAFTFSNSLIAFADALREINGQINSNFSLDVTIEAAGPGSFRARIGTHVKSIGGLFKSDAKSLLINLLATFIYVRILDPQTPPQITVNDDSVVIQTGSDRVIVPRSTWEAREKLAHPKAVQKHISRAFQVIREDVSVTDFGLAASLDEVDPVGSIDRIKFAILATVPEEETDKDDEPFRDERTHLTVLKIVFERGTRKWQFVWNGIRISAPIKDEVFFDKIAAREYDFGQGDILDVTLRIYQVRDEMSGALINDHYDVMKVHGQQKMPRQTRLL